MKDEEKSKEALIVELNALRLKYAELNNSFLKMKKSEEGGTKTILVVDDNEDTREVIVSMLEALGYKLLEANSSQKALEIVQSNIDTIHLVLSDVVMPKTNGPKMIEQILKVIPGIKVIFMSGYAEDEIVHDDVFNILNKKTAFIKKPFEIKAINRIIRQQFEK